MERQRDIEVLTGLEIALRNIAGPWEAAREVAGRRGREAGLAQRADYLTRAMRSCAPSVLISATQALREAMEGRA